MAPVHGVLRGAGRSLKDIVEKRGLLLLLVRREIRAKYKDSVLGLLWSVARPLVMLFMYYVVIGQFLGAARGIPNFGVFIYAGLTVWGLFQEIVTTGTGSIVGNAGLIKKVQLPREIFPLATTGSALFNFVIQFAILVVAALVTGGFGASGNVGHLVAAFLVAVVWAVALALVLGAVNAYLRDVQYLVEIALMLGFWMSPIVYSWTMVSAAVSPPMAEVYLANPMTLAVLGVQAVMWSAGAPENFPPGLGIRLAVCLGVGLIVLVIAQRLFDRLQRNFAQEL
jgi:ABC-2 type transport system permease protein